MGPYEIAPATVAIAWLRAKHLIPVIGPRTDAQVATNLEAGDLDLTETQVSELDAAADVPRGYPYELLERTRERAGIRFAQTGSVL